MIQENQIAYINHSPYLVFAIKGENAWVANTNENKVVPLSVLSESPCDTKLNDMVFVQEGKRWGVGKVVNRNNGKIEIQCKTDKYGGYNYGYGMTFDLNGLTVITKLEPIKE